MAFIFVNNDTTPVTASLGDVIVTAVGSTISGTGAGILGQLLNNSVEVNVNGTVTSDLIGVDLRGTDDGTAAGVGDNVLTVGATGVLTGGTFGAVMGGSGAVLVNHGQITGLTFDGVYLGDSDMSSAANYGSITGARIGILVDGSTNTNIVNFGDITAAAVAILFQNSTGTVTNSGSIVSLSSVALQDVDTVVNSGLVHGAEEAFLDRSGDANSFTNSGHVVGDIDLGGGIDTFDGRGGTVDGAVIGGSGNDTFIIDDANILISELANGGNDTVQSFVSYRLAEEVENLSLSGEEDIDGIGNSAGNSIFGNSGANRLVGLGGDDFIAGLEGADTVRGGAGEDNLQGNIGEDLLIGGSDNDTMNGGEGDDILRGGNGDDRLNGGSDDDHLLGGSGDDIINGNDGDDTIIGGAGKDIMKGGGGRDVFVFKQADDSTVANEDVIKGFQKNVDLIRLTGVASEELLLTFDAGYTGVPQATVLEIGNFTRILVDIDGDLMSDMSIKINGVQGLDAGDFLM